MIILGIDPGPSSSAAVLWNTKSEEVPGPLYGVKGHEMSALAAAIYWWESPTMVDFEKRD